jgi:hypothetical protein
MSEMPIRLFISYSWTSDVHIDWVISLASNLRESGVDVILDKWDLKEGHDTFEFMEKMVTDPEVTKVILVCDRQYSEKADSRAGGVGAEAQIISPELYGKAEQNKFVAIVTEQNADGQAFVPAYFKTRLHIDLSDESLYATNFEQLLRWVYDKPLYVKPPIGKKPAFLSEDAPAEHSTVVEFRRAQEAVKQGRPNAVNAIHDFFDRVIENLEEFRIERVDDKEFDDLVAESLGKFLPYRNEIIDQFNTIARYRDDKETHKILHRFFENLIPFFNTPPGVNGRFNSNSDNFKFIGQELFLYAMASFLKHEKFGFAAHLMDQHYFVAGAAEQGKSVMVPFTAFRNYLPSLEARNKRLKLNRLSVHADMLEQRTHNSGISMDHLMQADFVLFLRNCFEALRKQGDQRWWPDALLYASYHHGTMELFARAQSQKYFNEMKHLFGVVSRDEFVGLSKAFESEELYVPQWQMDRPDLNVLMGLDELAMRP